VSPIDPEDFGIGQAYRRIEDPPLLRGAGRFCADEPLDRELHAVFLRSPHAHARLSALDLSVAAAIPGVVAILTADDMAASGIGALPFFSLIKAPDGGAVSVPPCLPLADGLLRYVGEPLALVLAETEAAARDAAEAIAMDVDPLPAVVRPQDAVAPQAPQLWPDAPGNVAALYEVGDRSACTAVFSEAEHVVRLCLTNNRVVVHPMEPRVAWAAFDSASGTYRLRCPNQAAHLSRGLLAEALAIAPERLHIRVPDVGGGFGARIVPIREELALLAAAKIAGRPISWRADRSETFLADPHGRDQYAEVALALDGSGKILAYDADVVANLGATASPFGIPIVSTTGHRVITGVYDIPLVSLRLRCVLTNSLPTGPYRGAGRPETIYRLERVMDAAARRLGLDPADLRRRNLIGPARMPYRNATGWTYDSGDFPAVLERALALADWQGFPDRRETSRAKGLLRGRGLACHIDTTSGVSLEEQVRLTLDAEGRVTLLSGTQAIGQGLAGTYAQLVAARLQIPAERIAVVQGDTARVPGGGGTYGSRSLYLGGGAVAATAETLAKRILEVAAAALEADPADLTLAEGSVRIAGTDRAITLAALAARAEGAAIQAEERLEAPYCFPNGCYIAEVEVAPETGVWRLDRFLALDDVGRAINPPVVAGQVMGGLAQGLGQAAMEHCRYDPESGQLLSGSLMDYALPRADDLPPLDSLIVRHDERWPATTNPLGAKGAGESGAVGAPPALVAAVVDAIGRADLDHLDMPLTSERVWRALRCA